jgi:hypothetical protein
MLGVKITVTDHGIIANFERDIDHLLGEFAERIMYHFRRIMTTGARSGRVYRQGRFDRRSRISGQRPQGRGDRFHRASAPGEPLASDSGRTEKSITVRRLKSGVYRVRVGGAAGYWEIRGGSDRRPTLVPAIEAAAQEIFNGSEL